MKYSPITTRKYRPTGQVECRICVRYMPEPKYCVKQHFLYPDECDDFERVPFEPSNTFRFQNMSHDQIWEEIMKGVDK